MIKQEEKFKKVVSYKIPIIRIETFILNIFFLIVSITALWAISNKSQEFLDTMAMTFGGILVAISIVISIWFIIYLSLLLISREVYWRKIK